MSGLLRRLASQALGVPGTVLPVASLPFNPAPELVAEASRSARMTADSIAREPFGEDVQPAPRSSNPSPVMPGSTPEGYNRAHASVTWQVAGPTHEIPDTNRPGHNEPLSAQTGTPPRRVPEVLNQEFPDTQTPLNLLDPSRPYPSTEPAAIREPERLVLPSDFEELEPKTHAARSVGGTIPAALGDDADLRGDDAVLPEAEAHNPAAVVHSGLELNFFLQDAYPEPLLPSIARRSPTSGTSYTSDFPAQKRGAYGPGPGATEDITEVHVSIGRIEVTAVSDAPAKPQRQVPERKGMSLDDYLNRRKAGGT